MRTHHRITFSLSNQPAENKKFFSQIALMAVFTKALDEQDARNQRYQISEGLRVATIQGIDGLDILRQALNQKYEAKSNEIKANPIDIDSTGFQCPKCSKPFKSANALNAHRPSKCNGQ